MKVELLDSNLDMRTKYLASQSMNLTNIFQVVGSRKDQEGYDELKCNVEAEGFKNPIILIPNTLENFNLAIRQVEEAYIKDWENSRPYLCMYGNQRIQIALDLRISQLQSIITPTVEWAHATHLKLIP